MRTDTSNRHEEQLQDSRPRGALIGRRADHHVAGMASGNDLSAYLIPELTWRPPCILSPAAYHWTIYP